MRVFAGFAAALLCSTAGSSFGGPPSQATSLQIPGYALPQPLPLESFRLFDQQGDEFTLDDLRSRWTLLFFGYTHCPDVCPATLAQLRSVTKLMARQPGAVSPAVVLVSIDPQRDSADRLKEYSAQLGSDFTGVGGEPAAIRSFAAQFQAKYSSAGGTGRSYLIDHTSSVALINPNAELQVLFSVPLRPEAVAAELQRLTKTSPNGR